MTASTPNGLISRRGCGSKAITGIVQRVLRCCVTRRFGTLQKVEAIVKDLVQPSDAGVVGTEGQEPLACVRRTGWGIEGR